MENVSKAQYWNNSVTKSIGKVQLALPVGIVLVVILGGLIIFNPFIGVISASTLFLLVLVARRPVLIVYGLIVILPLTAGLARGAAVPFLRIGQALLVVGFILFVVARPTRLGKGRLTIIDLAFALFFLSEAVFPVLALYYRGEHLHITDTNNIYGVSPVQTLLGPIQYYLLYRIIVATIYSEKQIITVLKLSFATSIVVSAIGILEKAIPAFKTLVELYYPPISTSDIISDSATRIASTLQHYSGLGAYLTFTIILALVCCTALKRLKISPLFLIVTLLLNSITLVLTGSFATWIGLALGIIIVFLLIRRFPKMLILTLVGIALAVLLFQPFISSRLDQELGAGAIQGFLPQSFAFRIMLWQTIFLPAVGQYLPFGAGPTPAVLQIWPTEETQYLYMLLRGGLPYFFSYFLLMGVAVGTCWRQIKRRSGDASHLISIALLAILVCINVMNISGSYFTYAGGTQIIWTLLAMVVASEQFTKLESSAASPIVDSKWQVVRMPFHSSPGIAMPTALNSLTTENLVSNPGGLTIASRDGHILRLASLVRIPDWIFVKDSIVVGTGSTFARALGLLFWILLAHFLTPDDVGFVRYSTTLAGIIAIVATASPTSLSRFLAANRHDQQARDRYFSNGLLGVAVLTAVSLLISIPVLWLLHSLNLGTILCIVGLIGFFFYFAVARGMNNSWKMGLAYFLSNSVQIIVLLVVLGFFRLHTVTAVLMIYGLTFLTPIILELITPDASRFRPSLISKSTLLELMRFALPIVTASAVYTIWFGTDILLVENFNPHAAGSYAAAKTLAGAFIFIPTAITLVLMPRVANLGLLKSKRYTAGAVLATFVLCLFGLVIVVVGGHKLINLTFGQRYGDAYLPLLVVCVGMSFYSIYIILEGFIIGRGWPMMAVKALIVALICTLVTGFWLIPHLGILGASLAFTVGAIFSTLTMLLQIWLVLRKEKRSTSNEPSSADLAIASIKRAADNERQ
jgi:O-antigen/teichoic acid export membrane protein